MFQPGESPVSGRRRMFTAIGVLIVMSGVALGGVANAAGVPKGDDGENDQSSEAVSMQKAASMATTISTVAKTAGKQSTASTIMPAGCPNSYHGVNTGHGANVSGAYDSDCDGAASMNGSDDGVSQGKPTAGAVGNADYKNPPGQAPNGSDKNNGYECDGNSGVGKTNPAHSGCTTLTTSTTVGPNATATPMPAMKNETKTTTPKVGGTNMAVTTSTTIAKTTTTTPATVTGKALAFTGANVMRLIVIGSVLLIIGLSLMFWRKRVRS